MLKPLIDSVMGGPTSISALLMPCKATSKVAVWQHAPVYTDYLPQPDKMRLQNITGCFIIIVNIGAQIILKNHTWNVL